MSYRQNDNDKMAGWQNVVFIKKNKGCDGVHSPTHFKCDGVHSPTTL